jgi:hypothetical protein
MDKIFAVYALISGLCMFVLWGVFYAMGWVAEELANNPISFSALLCAECCTALALLAGGFGTLAKKPWGIKLALAAMGMMLYAVLYGAGHFAQQGNVLLAMFFTVLSLATVILLILELGNQKSDKL